MGKQNEKKKKQGGSNSGDWNTKQSKIGENNPKAYDKDTIVFISMSNELKDEGNRLFQKRDYEGAMLKYEKALKLLPRSHVDVSYLRSNMAACYMQMGLSEYPRAIHECNLALEVTPKYSKALLKRARCYEALNRLDLALRDCTMVLKMEPNNLMATEIAERIRTTIDVKGVRENKVEIDLVPVPEYVDPSKLSKEKLRKKKRVKIVEKNVKEEINEKKAEEKNEEKKGKENIEEINAEEKVEETKGKEKIKQKKDEVKIKEKKVKMKNEETKVKVKNKEKFEEKKAEEKIEEKKAEDKLVVEEKISTVMEEEFKRTVKLVFAEDIRWAKIPPNCSILNLQEVVRDRFPNSEAFLIKYRDQEGDLVTITTSEELRWAEALGEQHGSVRLYLVQVNPEQDPFYEKVKNIDVKQNRIVENGNVGKLEDIIGGGLSCIDDWIIQFAQLFKNYVGFNSDAYLDLHELGTKLYSEAMEEAVTSEEAQELFNTAADKFQEMAALALFNWGNVHMSRARKRVYFTEDSSRESVLSQIKIAYEWAKEEYSKAGERYKEALRIKPDFYEGVVALGQQQFEQAKLSWYYAIGTNVDIQTWPSNEVIQLYNSAEDNMEKGMQMWELAEEHRLNELSRSSKVKTLLQKMNLGGLIKDLSADEAAEQTANMRSQINLLWGTMLYERSIMEYKLGLPVWQECLEVAVEKFELAGASPTDVAVMMKNHCSNDATLEGLGFNIDEIVQAWNEMYEAKRWQSSVPSFRLEPLLRRRVSKLYHAFEHA